LKPASFLLLLLVVACTGEAISEGPPKREIVTSLAPITQFNASPGTTEQTAVSHGPLQAPVIPGLGPAHEIIRGNGQVINRGISARRNVPQSKPGSVGDVTLNFTNADVHEVVKAVLGNILGLNYVIDPTVQGTVSIQTSRPLTREAVLPAFATALRAIGVTFVEVGGVYRVVPLQDAPRQGELLSRSSEETASGFRLEVVPLRYVGVGDMQKVLEPLVPAGAIVHIDPERNLLILGGTGEELASILDTISIFDVDQLAGKSFGVFPLKSVDAKSIVAELNELLKDEAGAVGGLVRLQAIERINAILAVSSQPAYLDRIQLWIDRLDRPTESADQRLYVYYVQNGRAKDLASVLSKALTKESGERSPTGENLMPSSQRTEITYTPSNSQAIPGGIDKSGPSARSTGQTQSPGELPEGDGSINFIKDSSFKITADEINNALLIFATPHEYFIVEDALKKLDILPLQVLIEAAIAEVTLTKELQYGVQYFIKQGNNSVTFSNGTSSAIAAAFPGFAYMFSAGANIRAILNLLQSVTDVRVISSPHLLVLNNQAASLQVGDQVPIATQQATSVLTPGAPLVNTIEFRDTGVILKVTPRVNKSGLVLMDISQEVSDVSTTTTSGLDSPTISQRKFSSSVAVRSGETIALGGLIKDSITGTRNGLPFLSSIPIIGPIFGSTDDQSARTELIVLITPRVVRDLQNARDVTDEFRRKVPLTWPLSERIR
jgi:general secretion pathway protein D